MADFKIPNLCGASPAFNAIQSKFETMMNSAIDGLEVDASTLKVTLDTDLTSLVIDIKVMIPELPALPNINLQVQLTSLSGLTIGSSQYNTLLADITTKFGSELTAGGYSLDTLVSDAAAAIAGGTNLCSAVPNFEVDAAGVNAATEKAIAVLQSALDSEKEKPSVQLANSNVIDAATNAVTSFNKFFRKSTETETLPTKDTGAYTVATKSTSVATSADGKVLVVKVTTPRDATVVVDGKSEKNNVSKDGFSTRPVVTSQKFFDKPAGILLLKYEPAGNYFPRVLGFIDLTHLSASDATRTTIEVSVPGWTKEEIEKGWGAKQLFPEGHPGSFGLAFRSVERGKMTSGVTGARQGKKITDTFTVETGLGGDFPTMIEFTDYDESLLYDYTGTELGSSGHKIYWSVKYKYNSRHDPN